MVFFQMEVFYGMLGWTTSKSNVDQGWADYDTNIDSKRNGDQTFNDVKHRQDERRAEFKML